MGRGLVIIHIKAYLSNLDVVMPGEHPYSNGQILIIWILLKKFGRCLWMWPENRKYAKKAKGRPTDKPDGNLPTPSHAQILEDLKRICNSDAEGQMAKLRFWGSRPRLPLALRQERL